MATINKNIIKPKRVGYSKPIEKDMDNSSNYYNSEAWRRLRAIYVKEHPVCEICLKYEHIEPTVDVHHRYRFMAEHTEIGRWNSFLNYNNLISLCKPCHNMLHYKMRHNRLNSCDTLTEDEWKQGKQMYADGSAGYQ